MLDHRFQLISEADFVVSFAEFIEIDGVVDDNSRLVFLPIVVKSFQLDDQNFGAKRDFLVLLGVAGLFTGVAAVSIDSFVDVLVEVGGDGSIGDLGRDRKGETRVSIVPAARFMSTLATGNDAGGDNLGSGLEH